MAACVLPPPGTELGPCSPTTASDPIARCQHRDCAETVRMAWTGCAHCDQPIGYGTRFYERPLRHARCEEAAAERSRQVSP